jgi:hypothetical protein
VTTLLTRLRPLLVFVAIIVALLVLTAIDRARKDSSTASHSHPETHQP